MRPLVIALLLFTLAAPVVHCVGQDLKQQIAGV